MPKICYVERKFSGRSTALITQANAIIDEYRAQGFVLTLRQLYYQFVSRDLIPNSVKEYRRLGSVVNDARLAGLIDWNSIEDRTRNLSALNHWTDPAQIVGACADQFRIDKWADQEVRIEVWIEKEALAGVFEAVCNDLDVPFLSCRGYTSQSEMWSAAMRLRRWSRFNEGQRSVVLHFGDHDPSGIDMTRDIRDRLRTFGASAELRRLALNMDQVERYSPPPNPAKETDSRFAGYIEEYGSHSWELDALEPKILTALVRKEVEDLRDPALWNDAIGREEEMRRSLRGVSDRWIEVAEMIRKDQEEE